MSHIHGVTDIDSQFTIDPITRAVKNEALTKTTLIQGDHNSERFTFTLPRMIEGHDMATCNKVEVHFLNVDAETRQKSAGVYIVDDFQVDPEDDTKVVCSWLISGNATKYRGVLNFVVRYTCGDGENLDYIWSTAIYSGVGVSDGICNTENVLGEYLDVLEAWKAELYSHETVDVGLIDIDDVPTDGSPNLITSGGVKKYYDQNTNTKYSLQFAGNALHFIGTDGSHIQINRYGESREGIGSVTLPSYGTWFVTVRGGSSISERTSRFTAIIRYYEDTETGKGVPTRSQAFVYFGHDLSHNNSTELLPVLGHFKLSADGELTWECRSYTYSLSGVTDTTAEISCVKLTLI